MIHDVRRERALIESGGAAAKPDPYRLEVSALSMLHPSGDAR